MMPRESSHGPGDRNERDAALPALTWVRRAGAEDELIAEVDRQVRRRRRRRLATVAGCAGLALAAGVLWLPGRKETAPAVALSTAAVTRPEWRRLADGSAVELKPGAEIEFDNQGPVRRVALRRGEAHFEVRKSERPFVVEAGSVTVRAVGTAFSVQLGADDVEVVVTEGRVQVAREETAAPVPDGASPSVPELAAGYRAVLGRKEGPAQIDALSEAQVASRLAWRVPSLEFSRTPLDEVVALMNRYGADRSGVRFEIGDPSLRRVSLSGFLQADNADGLVRLLESQFSVRAERSRGTIILRRAR